MVKKTTKKKCAGMEDMVKDMNKHKKNVKANAKKCPEFMKELCEQGADMLGDVMDYTIDGVEEVKETGLCW